MNCFRHDEKLGTPPRVEGNLDAAVWSAMCAERFQTLLKFKESIASAVYMGQSVRRLVDVLQIWESASFEAPEEFWQETFKEHSFVLSQVFAEPMVFIQDKAYVGGMGLDRSNSRVVDYLLSIESSRESVLVEIKKPSTRLMSGEYRDLALPSRDVLGSVLQLANYRKELVENLKNLAPSSRLEAFSPRCVLIIGNAESELKSDGARRSFELFRASLHDVQLITYDELFKKVAHLASLFGLERTSTGSS